MRQLSSVDQVSDINSTTRARTNMSWTWIIDSRGDLEVEVAG